MSSGLLALLDDVVDLAHVAAASLDDAASQAAAAGLKAAGVVIDDTAVTPSYVIGFGAERELPIIGRIALGSLRNKLLYLLPAALALSLVAPWAITPLLMLGGAYLCFEGAEKIWHGLRPRDAGGHAGVAGPASGDAKALEDAKVRGAIQTDFILSAEIMAITLGGVADSGVATQAFVLAVVGTGVTALVYGAVALIVKADDAGLALARRDGRLVRGVGRALVRGAPLLLRALGTLGTAAMLWVGGGIILHGLEGFGLGGMGHAIHDAAEAAAAVSPGAEGVIAWAVTACASGAFGLLLGVVLVAVVKGVAGLAART